jgi:hypothetical protein
MSVTYGFTETYTVTSALAVDVVAHVYCSKIQVGENWSSTGPGPTTDYYVVKQGAGTTGSGPVTVPIGKLYEFTKPSPAHGGGPSYGYRPGEVVGSIQLTGPVATATFLQDES